MYKFLIILLLAMAISVSADDFVVSEPGDQSYNYVSDYSVSINAETETVWQQLLQLNEWMYDFDLSHHSGEKGQVGQVLRLYPSQEFYIQITGMVPGKLLTFVNLPSEFMSEASFGNAIIVVSDHAGSTEVSLVMSRRYTYLEDGDNPMKAKRASEPFQKASRAMWDRFLQRLKENSEKRT